MTLSRLVAPWNNHATAVAGATLVTTASASLVHSLTDAVWLQHLWLALHGYGDVANDKTPIFQLVAIGFGYLLGFVALYVGAPWFVRTDPPPPPESGVPAASSSVIPIQKAA